MSLKNSQVSAEILSTEWVLIRKDLFFNSVVKFDSFDVVIEYLICFLLLC